MSAARGNHAAALLPDGRVLISGGDGNDPAAPPLGTEIFDPATGQFSPGGNLQAPRDSHSAVSLTDGRVLVIGGEVRPVLAGRADVGVRTTEIFDPATGRWSAGPMLDPAFSTATVTLLSTGKVLIFGGQDAGGWPQAAAALFE
jgi:N-acetylneuraminic acid mutarotase